MSDCVSIRRLLPLSAGGDLSPAEEARVRGHLSDCQGCRAVESNYLDVIALARQTYSEEHCLAPWVKAQIAREAESSAGRRWSFSLPSFALLGYRPVLLATVTALLLAVLVLPVAMRPGNVAVGTESMKIDVVAQGSEVRLAWSDGNRGSYTVYKTTDPRNLNRGQAFRVSGNSWVDRDPGPATVVYYAIE